jgi:hypothetical protein
MPKKGKKAKKAVVPEAQNVANVVADYKKVCGLLNLMPPSEQVLQALVAPEGEEHLPEINVEGFPALGAGGVRALASALIKQDAKDGRVVPFGLQPDGAILPNSFQPDGDAYGPLLALKLNCCQLGDTGAAVVAAMLRPGAKLPLLETLELKQNEIALDGCIALGDALTTNTGLKTVRLDQNFAINCRCAKVLCLALAVKRNLLELSLVDCSVSREGCRGVARLLSTEGVELQILRLSGNSLTADGLRILCSGLSEARSLTTVALSATGIGFVASVRSTVLEAHQRRAYRHIKAQERTADNGGGYSVYSDGGPPHLRGGGRWRWALGGGEPRTVVCCVLEREYERAGGSHQRAGRRAGGGP